MADLYALVLAAHPDDAELCAGGTIASLTRQGRGVGIIDFTLGELGSRGTVETRQQEARRAADILGVSVRLNLGLPDGQIQDTPTARLSVVTMLRAYRPHVVFTHPDTCRHPDHVRAANLVKEAVFSAGLIKVETRDNHGNLQQPWRPHHVLQWVQSTPILPDLVVDVSDYWAVRMEAMRAYGTQFHARGDKEGNRLAGRSAEPETYISNPAYQDFIEARAKTWGYPIGAQYAEGFTYAQGPLGTRNLADLLSIERPFR